MSGWAPPYQSKKTEQAEWQETARARGLAWDERGQTARGSRSPRAHCMCSMSNCCHYVQLPAMCYRPDSITGRSYGVRATC